LKLDKKYKKPPTFAVSWFETNVSFPKVEGGGHGEVRAVMENVPNLQIQIIQ
jgi:hypothetical protein